MAGDGGGDARLECLKIFILLVLLHPGRRQLDDLGEHPFEARGVQTDGRRLDCQSLRPKWLDLEPISLQFVGYFGEYHHLPRLELHKQGHQEPLALHVFYIPLAQDLFEQDALVGDVLVDDPESVFAGGQNERLAELAECLQRPQMIEVLGGLLGLDLGCGLGGREGGAEA